MKAGLLLPVFLAACATPGRNVPVAVPAARAPTAEERIAADVGRLLSSDPRASAAAAERLRYLDEGERDALLAHARTIPMERDPRWLHVLDENHALPPLPPAEEVDFLVWKAARDDPYDVMKAQSRLLDLARARPEVLLDRLASGAPGTEPVAVALTLAGEVRALRPLLARYRAARTPAERRILAEAMTPLVGEALRPPSDGPPAALESAARAVEAWLEAREAAPPGDEDRA